MAKITEVLSGGEVVGTLRDARPDMWYLEGAFSPADTPAAVRFASAAAGLDRRAAMADPTRGIRVELREPPSDARTTFIVMSLADGRLFGRCVFDPRDVEWAARKVPESPADRPQTPRRPWWRFW